MPTCVLSPSRFACEAIGALPEGRPWNGAGGERLRCALEGVEIQPGDPVERWRPGPGFTDDVDVAARTGVVSGWVSAFMRKPLMQATQRAVFTRDGVYSLAKDTDRAWLLLTPPDPPWLAVIADSTLQHLVWRTPLTLDNRAMRIRLGKDTILTINPDRLQQALQMIQAIRLENPRFTHGFQSLDREGRDPQHGVLRRDAPEHYARFVATLTAGEVWALAILAKANPPTPAMPERIRLKR